MKDKTGGPAFPRAGSIDPHDGSMFDGDKYVPEQQGMSRLDYFAAACMKGLLANPTTGADMKMVALTQGAMAACRTVAEAAVLYAVVLMQSVDVHASSQEED